MDTPLNSKQRPALLAVALVVTLSGCSFTDGEPWGSFDLSLSSQTSSAELIGPTEVALQSSPASLEVELVRVTTRSGGGGGEFDPSDPPEGYTLCHSGHCHSESGELVPYEEVRADMQGSGQTRETTLATGSAQIDLSQPFNSAVGPLPIGSRGEVSEVHVHSPNIVLNGEIERSGETVPMTARLGPVSLGRLALEGVEVGPDSPEIRTLTLCAQWPEPLFANVDLDGLEAQDDQILVTKIVNADAADAIIGALKDANWTQSCN